MSPDQITLFAAALSLGLVFNIAPGAVFAETVRQGVRGGFQPALAVQLGSLVGDALWAALGLLGVGLLLQLEALRMPIGISSAAYLLWLARDSWQAVRREFSLETGACSTSDAHAFHAGVLLSVTNPQNLAYWAAIGSTMGAIGLAQPTTTDYAVFFAGLMLASVLWCFVCATLINRVFRNASVRWARITYRACAVAFLALALSSLRDLVRSETAAPRVTPPAVHGKR